MSDAVAVTGIGILSALGAGVRDNWSRMLAGASGITTISRFPTEGLKTTIAGCVDFLDLPRDATLDARAIAMGDIVVHEALSQSGYAEHDKFPGDFFLAQAPHEFPWPQLLTKLASAAEPTYEGLLGVLDASCSQFGPTTQFVADHFAERHQLKRRPICPVTACASGATAIQLAVEAIRDGECPVAVAVGTDGIVRQELIARFSLLSALSVANDVPDRASKPFSLDRDGFVFGEGAASLVLEDAAHARRRGARILAYVHGCGEAGDSYHRTRSNPSAEPLASCMERALRDAGVTVDQVDYVNAHGTSTPENDKMEYRGLRLLYGTNSLPAVSSIKSMIGHTIHAAGVIEAACTVLTLVTQQLPPTINYRIPDPEIPLDVVPNVARRANVRYALSNSFGFGGQNVSLLLGRSPAL